MLSPLRGSRMGLLGCCCGCRAELPGGTSSHLGRGWEGARVCQGDEKLGVRDPACSLLQRCLPGVGWDGMGCPSCSIPFPAGSSQAQLREDRAGQIHPWRKAGGGEWPQPRQALSLLGLQQWNQTPFIGELHPQSPAPQMQERSRAGTLFLAAWVTQHPTCSLAQPLVPQSLQDLSSLLGLAETEECHCTGDVSVPTVPHVTLRTHRRGPQHPLLCHVVQGSPGSTIPFGRIFEVLLPQFPCGGRGEGWERRGRRKPRLTWVTPGMAYTTGLQDPAGLTALP